MGSGFPAPPTHGEVVDAKKCGYPLIQAESPKEDGHPMETLPDGGS